VPPPRDRSLLLLFIILPIHIPIPVSLALASILSSKIFGTSFEIPRLGRRDNNRVGIALSAGAVGAHGGVLKGGEPLRGARGRGWAEGNVGVVAAAGAAVDARRGRGSACGAVVANVLRGEALGPARDVGAWVRVGAAAAARA
jgi:hypothetical protein